MLEDEDVENTGTEKRYNHGVQERSILLPHYDHWLTARCDERREIYKALEPELNRLRRRQGALVSETWSYQLIGQWFENEKARRARRMAM